MGNRATRYHFLTRSKRKDINETMVIGKTLYKDKLFSIEMLNFYNDDSIRIRTIDSKEICNFSNCKIL